MRLAARLAAPALALALAAGAGADSHIDLQETLNAKESDIQQASIKSVSKLAQLKKEGKLDDASALELIQFTLSPQFDFAHLTRRTMGKYWARVNDEQRAEIIRLFRAKIEKTYARSLSKFDNQQISFPPAVVQGNGDVKIGIDIEHRGNTIYLHYILTFVRGEWVINDFLVENVSLTQNFRSQFSVLIRKEGIEGFIARLRQDAAKDV